MESVSSNTSRQRHQLPRSMRSLSQPVVYSPSLRKFAAKPTLVELRCLLAKDVALPTRLAPISNRLWIKFYQCGICRELSHRLHQMLLLLVLRWPLLQKFLPTIRKRGQLAALLDRVQIESGGELSTSAPALLVRQLRAYQDEMPRLTVTHSAAVL